VAKRATCVCVLATILAWVFAGCRHANQSDGTHSTLAVPEWSGSTRMSCDDGLRLVRKGGKEANRGQAELLPTGVTGGIACIFRATGPSQGRLQKQVVLSAQTLREVLNGLEALRPYDGAPCVAIGGGPSDVLLVTNKKGRRYPILIAPSPRVARIGACGFVSTPEGQWTLGGDNHFNRLLRAAASVPVP
jgi:hypothetical protein